MMPSDYLEYLTDVISLNGLEKNYSRLLSIMHELGFYNVVELDKNRMNDVYDILRDPWAKENHVDFMDLILPSVLEVLVALSVHVVDYIGEDFERNFNVPNFFWEMIRNLGWDIYTDDWFFNMDKEEDPDLNPVAICKSDILNFVMRKYSFDGIGGPFPVPNGKSQKGMDLWRQAMLYIVYKYPLK